MKNTDRGHVFVVIGWALLGSTLAWPVASASQRPPVAAYEGTDRVTAIDVLVLAPWAKGPRGSEKLETKDFKVLVDGHPASLVAVEPAGASAGWRTLIYFDYELAGERTVRWAAEVLAEQVMALTERGPVEIVVADPLPRQRLLPSRDPTAVRTALAQLALKPGGREVLVTLRSEVLEEIPIGRTGLLPEELVAWASAEEKRRVERQQDRLLSWLLATPNEGERLLFWVTDGFDLRPADFYGSQVEGNPLAAEGALLAEPSTDLAQTVAAYGWLTFPLKAPEAPPPPPGKRIGKWRVQGLFLGPFVVGGAVRESERDPELAEAYVELGDALLAQGEAEQSEDAYRKALHHFYRDPRTAERQAVAEVGLGRALRELSEMEGARRAFRRALDLDPEVTLEEAIPEGILLDPLPPLQELAMATGGRLLRDPSDLEEAVESLRRRLRLTYQVAGDPLGSLVPIEIRGPGGKVLPGASWGRSSIPLTVSKSRLRLASSTLDIAGPLALRVDLLESASAGNVAELELSLDQSSIDSMADGALLRLSWGLGSEEQLNRAEHLPVEAVAVAELSTWRGRIRATAGGEDTWVAVLVEDLLSGLWKVELVPLRPEFQLEAGIAGN